MPAYKIKGWSEFFEGAKSRGYKVKNYCTMPCKHGLGYKRIIKRPDGPALFGAWCALIQTLSRHSERNGYCTDNGFPPHRNRKTTSKCRNSKGGGPDEVANKEVNEVKRGRREVIDEVEVNHHEGDEVENHPTGRPLTPEDLELLTDIPAKIFQDLYHVCSSEEVDWMIVISDEETSRIPQGYHKDTTEDRGSPPGNRKDSSGNHKDVRYPPIDIDVDVNVHEDKPASGDADGFDEVILTKKKKKLQGKRLKTFLQFWEAFAYKKGKAEAADAWLEIPQLTMNDVSNICAAARRTAEKRPEVIARGTTPQYAQGWLSGRRWEDDPEADRKASEATSNGSGPSYPDDWKELLREIFDTELSHVPPEVRERELATERWHGLRPEYQTQIIEIWKTKTKRQKT